MSAKTMYISKDSSTVMKGLAIIAVILSHLPRVINFPSFMKSMLHPLGYLGVAVFLCLSGYGCAMSIICGGAKSTKAILEEKIEQNYARACNCSNCYSGNQNAFFGTRMATLGSYIECIWTE